MKKSRMIILAALIACVLIVSLWFYWEHTFSLNSVLPEENWTRVEISIGDPGVGDEQWQGTVDLEAVLTALEYARVSRGPEFPGMTQPFFQVTLYKGEAYPTHITVVKNGQIAVAEELDFDNYKYYEGGDWLYAALLTLTAG